VPECEEQREYEIDEQGRQELEVLQHKLETVQQQITDLERRLEHLFPRDVADHFHLGMVGRGGRASAKLNSRKIGVMDSSIELTKKLEPLYRERTRLTALIADVTSGRRKREREREARRKQRRKAAEARVQAAAVGDYVLDSAFGLVKVVRRNRKTLTIETSSGYREARPFALIENVVGRSPLPPDAPTGPCGERPGKGNSR
jgi:hypothetical protein